MQKKLTLNTFLEILFVLIVVAVFDLIGNWVGYGVGILQALPGMLIMFVIGVVGILLTYVIPINCPSIIYISIIGVLVACPLSPVAVQVKEYADQVNLLALVTCILAYSGVSMAKNWADFRKIGWRGIVVALLVMFGTFILSAIVANIVLSAQGII